MVKHFCILIIYYSYIEAATAPSVNISGKQFIIHLKQKSFMRKTFLFLIAVVMLAACSNEKKEETKADDQAKSSVALPYTASYSSSFEMGDPKHVATILQGSWKDWEENKLNKTNWLADTIVAYHSNFMVTQGADSLIARWKRFRNGYTSVIDTIEAAMSVRSKDKNENWVLVWGKEINTNLEGKTDTSYLMETWRINKDGKADMLLQHDRARRKE
jgi:hypothetical protein